MSAVVAVDGVTVRYGRRTAVEKVSFNVARGSTVALLGRNGAGKTSLVRCLLGQQRPEGGTVRIFGRDAPEIAPHAADEVRDLGFGKLGKGAAHVARSMFGDTEARIRRPLACAIEDASCPPRPRVRALKVSSPSSIGGGAARGGI